MLQVAATAQPTPAAMPRTTVALEAPQAPTALRWPMAEAAQSIPLRSAQASRSSETDALAFAPAPSRSTPRQPLMPRGNEPLPTSRFTEPTTRAELTPSGAERSTPQPGPRLAPLARQSSARRDDAPPPVAQQALRPALGGAFVATPTVSTTTPTLVVPSTPRVAAASSSAAPLTPRSESNFVPLAQLRLARVAVAREPAPTSSPFPQATVAALGGPNPGAMPTAFPAPIDAPAPVPASSRRTVPAFVGSAAKAPDSREPVVERDDRPALRRVAAPELTAPPQRVPDAAPSPVAKPFDTKFVVPKDTRGSITLTAAPATATAPKSPATPQAAAPAMFEAMATRAKAQHEVQRTSTTSTGHLHQAKHGQVPEPEPATTERKKVRDELKPEGTSTPLVIAAPPASPTIEPLTVVPPPPAAAALEPMLTQVAEDPSLRISLMPTMARVSLETPDAGRVSLQLKVADGVTDVRASGPAAASLELRQNELRVALAQEGLALGHFDLTQSNQQQQRPERPDPDLPRATRPTTASAERVDDDGRLHVKA